MPNKKPSIADVAKQRLRLVNSRGDRDAVPAQDRNRNPLSDRKIPNRALYERDPMTDVEKQQVERSLYNSRRGMYPRENYAREKRRANRDSIMRNVGGNKIGR